MKVPTGIEVADNPLPTPRAFPSLKKILRVGGVA